MFELLSQPYAQGTTNGEVLLGMLLMCLGGLMWGIGIGYGFGRSK